MNWRKGHFKIIIFQIQHVFNVFFYRIKLNLSKLTTFFIPTLSITYQKLSGENVAKIVHTIWDIKKIPEPKDECSETSEAGDIAQESFRYFEDGLYISNGSNFFVFEDTSKIFSVLNRLTF